MDCFYQEGLGQGRGSGHSWRASPSCRPKKHGKQIQRHCPWVQVLAIYGQMYHVSFYMFYVCIGMFLFLCVVAYSFHNCMHFHTHMCMCVNISHVYNCMFGLLCFSLCRWLLSGYCMYTNIYPDPLETDYLLMPYIPSIASQTSINSMNEFQIQLSSKGVDWDLKGYYLPSNWFRIPNAPWVQPQGRKEMGFRVPAAVPPLSLQ